MPALDRSLKITYGSVVIGGPAAGTAYIPVGKLAFEQTRDTGFIEFDVVCQHDTRATFVANVAALEAEFKTPHLRLTVAFGADTRLDVNPATRSGFNTLPTIEQLDDETDTEHSARFTCRVDFSNPASFGTNAGRRDSSVSVSAAGGSGQRVVRISGTWTGIGGVSARDQYAAQIDTFANTTTAAIDAGAVWAFRRSSEKVDADDQNNVVTFERSYDEIIFPESLSATNDPDLESQQLTIEIATVPGPDTGDDESAQPKEVVAQYSVFVSKTNTNLVQKWQDVILPHILNRIRSSVADAGNFAVMKIAPSYDLPNNAISATVRVQVFSKVGLIHSLETIEDSIGEGERYIPVADGLDYSYDKHQTIKQTFRTVTRVEMRVAGSSPSGPGFFAIPPGSIRTRGAGARIPIINFQPGKASTSIPTATLRSTGTLRGPARDDENFRLLQTRVSHPRRLLRGIPGFRVPLIQQSMSQRFIRVDNLKRDDIL